MARTVVQGGRAKAYWPLPAKARRAAFEAGLEAYERGDFFLAHELLEPAWMGTRDLPERELIQGIIKLAAAFVHDARGNPAGIGKNLRGARDRLANASVAGARLGIDLEGLLEQLDRVLSGPQVVGEPPIRIDRVPRSGAGGNSATGQDAGRARSADS
jgi:predicted metal-dependent hydrolase